MEALGVDFKPLCGGCKCGNCPPGGHDYSLKDERELSLIKKGLRYDGKVWTSDYPWVKEANNLPDNRPVAYATLMSTEKRLAKNSILAESYKSQMDDMVKRGASRKLSIRELQDYKGPMHYISHHEVLNPSSKTTPCRIVFNASANFHGHVFNDYLAKGPDLINNLLGINLRFRENLVALAGDVSQMYHSVYISEKDQHTHRDLWRNLDTEKLPETYIMKVVSFGDRPAGTIASVALLNTAEMQKDKFPEVYKCINKNIYVDDILDSVDTREKGNFKVKDWTFSGGIKDEIKLKTHQKPNLDEAEISVKDFELSVNTLKDINDESQKGQKVLGMWWNVKEDFFHFKICLNFSKKKRGLRSEPNLHKHEVVSKLPQDLTRRMVLSQVNGFFDPAGLAMAFTVRAKILMRYLWIGIIKDVCWDEPIPSKLRERWQKFFIELFGIESIKFRRCLKPVDMIIGYNPQLIVFCDGSKEAYGTVAYARWELQNGTFTCSLIASKCKVTSLKVISTVLSELNGAVLGKRLKEFVMEESRIQFEKVLFIGGF